MKLIKLKQLRDAISSIPFVLLEKLGGVVLPHLLHLKDGLRLPVPSSETFFTIICYIDYNIPFFEFQAKPCKNNYAFYNVLLFHQP